MGALLAESEPTLSFVLFSEAAGLSFLEVVCVDVAGVRPFAAWAYEKTGAEAPAEVDMIPKQFEMKVCVGSALPRF